MLEEPAEEEPPVAAVVRVAEWTVEMVMELLTPERPALIEAETTDPTLDATLDSMLEIALEMADSTGLVLEGVGSALVLAGKSLGR